MASKGRIRISPSCLSPSEDTLGPLTLCDGFQSEGRQTHLSIIHHNSVITPKPASSCTEVSDRASLVDSE